jgi:hypothetical protein
MLGRWLFAQQQHVVSRDARASPPAEPPVGTSRITRLLEDGLDGTVNQRAFISSAG